jgi:hypothetical protein
MAGSIFHCALWCEQDSATPLLNSDTYRDHNVASYIFHSTRDKGDTLTHDDAAAIVADLNPLCEKWNIGKVDTPLHVRRDDGTLDTFWLWYTAEMIQSAITHSIQITRYERGQQLVLLKQYVRQALAVLHEGARVTSWTTVDSMEYFGNDGIPGGCADVMHNGRDYHPAMPAGVFHAVTLRLCDAYVEFQKNVLPTLTKPCLVVFQGLRGLRKDVGEYWAQDSQIHDLVVQGQLRIVSPFYPLPRKQPEPPPRPQTYTSPTLIPDMENIYQVFVWDPDKVVSDDMIEKLSSIRVGTYESAGDMCRTYHR